MIQLLLLLLIGSLICIIRLYVLNEILQKEKIQNEVNAIHVVKRNAMMEQDLKTLLIGTDSKKVSSVADKWTAYFSQKEQEPILQQINDLCRD